MKKKVIIVGSGPGGLASAMLLAHKGFDVQVFESADRIGGRNRQVKLGPYSFDLGPTFLMMKFLLDEIFQEAGRKTSDYLDIRRLDPMYLLDFKSSSLRVSGNREFMKQEIAKNFPGEEAGLDKFYEKEAVRFERMYPCLQRNYGKLSTYLSPELFFALPYLSVGDSLYDVLTNYFQSEELRLSFTFQSKYLGMSPWECPGAFGMIPYVEHAHGIYHVQGGLWKIQEAFAKAMQEDGGKLTLNAPVDEVLVENGNVVGVRLKNGELHRADEVVLNADFGYAMTHFFKKTPLKKYTPQKLNKMKYSCSTFMMYLGVDIPVTTDHHAIYFAKDYKKNLEDISVTKVPSEDLSIYLRNASVTDPSLAPAGHSALYILAPTPNNESGIDWDKYKPIYRKKILEILEERAGLKDLEKHIREELIVTPKDWEEKMNVYKGATFNLGHNLSQMLYFRPHNRFEEFNNCYLVGGGTHPGSGLPTIYESARISSQLICEKYKVPFPPPRPLKEVVHAGP